MKIIYPGRVSSVDFSVERRQEFLEKLKKEVYDLCVIGGGITGAGIARDATLRGLKTVLIDKADFGAGTSTKSSKLIHGGFRYLEQYRFGLVREALLERYRLLHLAPHLVSRLPSILPIFTDSKQGYWKIKAGMILYDGLCGRQRIGGHRMLSRTELLQLVPFFHAQGLRGAAHYYDARADDFRLLISTIQSAVLEGCSAVNYLEAVGLEKKGDRANALYTIDRITEREYLLRAKTFVNATGPWCDHFLRNAEVPDAAFVRPTKGIHILIPLSRLPLDQALMIISVLDNRPLFAVPWKNVVLLGTTDTDFTGDPDVIWSTPEDVRYLLDSFNYYFPRHELRERDIISSFAGLRPLVREEGVRTTRVSREHHIFEIPENVFNIIGGKLTTYRKMAVELLSFVKRHTSHVSIHKKSTTAAFPLYGGEIRDYAGFAKEKRRWLMKTMGVSSEIASHLIESYGCHVDDFINMIREDASLLEPIVPGLPFLRGQLPYAMQYEMNVALDDFLIRRTHILSLDWDQGRDVCRKIADEMGLMLGWGEKEKSRQIERYLKKVELTRRFRTET